MRTAVVISVALFLTVGLSRGDDEVKQAPKVQLQSGDGKTTYDLQKLTSEGPVLLRLTCACSGCDQELPFFQKLNSAYEAKGFVTLAVFQEKPETAKEYTEKKGVHFLWAADPKGELWKTFSAKSMPTNILIDKGGKIVKVLPGCTRDGKNAQKISDEVAKLLNTEPVKIAGSEPASKK